MKHLNRGGLNMSVTWPDNSKQAFGREILHARHSFSESDLFTDDGLAHLLDIYPRQSLDIWTFGENREGENPALRGRAPRMSGAEILTAVKNGHVWLNLRRVNLELEDMKPISDEIFGSLEDAASVRTGKRDMGLLISSPNVHVHYHLDIPMVALFQMRGQKRLWLYPTDKAYAPPEFIEQIVHMKREEDLPYQNTFDDEARVFDLTPGMGLTWPQLAPHRVQNASCMNVSLSCEYMTMKSLINANAIYTNGLMRKSMNLSPSAHNGMGPATLGKAAFARLHKGFSRRGPKLAPTPVTFELDTSVENCVKPLWI